MRAAVIGFGEWKLDRIESYFSEPPEELLLCGTGTVANLAKAYVEEKGILLTELLIEEEVCEQGVSFALFEQVAEVADEMILFLKEDSCSLRREVDSLRALGRTVKLINK